MRGGRGAQACFLTNLIQTSEFNRIFRIILNMANYIEFQLYSICSLSFVLFVYLLLKRKAKLSHDGI